MDLKQEFCKRIDNDFGYDNEKLADDLIEIAKKHLTKQLIIGGVVRSAVDIELRIKEIEEERREMLQNYIDSTDDKERDIISLIAMEKALTIKELKWVLNE